MRVVRNVVPNIGFDSFIDDWNSDDSKGLTCKDCEAPTLQLVCTSARTSSMMGLSS